MIFKLKIVIDGFGGDNAPIEILQGCALAVQDFDVELIVTGNKYIIEEEAKKNNISLNKIEIVNCESVLPVCEDPVQILKKYSSSSMAVGLSLLSKGVADAFISAGSTGGLVVGASFIVKRVKGVKRAAIATIIPTDKHCYMLIDSGANHICRPEMLAQFGLMGSIYMEKILKINNPKVGILNIGVEESKGTELQKEAAALLENSELNFVGNIEARDVPFGVADVVVTDGFVGNMILKYTEGLAKFFSLEIKEMFNENIFTKLSGAIVKKRFKKFKQKLDYSEFGGAILLGVQKPVIKAHGSSNAKAIKNAIKQAIKMVKNNTVGEIELLLKGKMLEDKVQVKKEGH